LLGFSFEAHRGLGELYQTGSTLSRACRGTATISLLWKLRNGSAEHGGADLGDLQRLVGRRFTAFNRHSGRSEVEPCSDGPTDSFIRATINRTFRNANDNDVTALRDTRCTRTRLRLYSQSHPPWAIPQDTLNGLSGRASTVGT
jgi:hypothetical protein